MRALILALVLLAGCYGQMLPLGGIPIGAAAPSAPTYVQSANTDNTFDTTCVVSLTGTTAGNTLVVGIVYNSASGTITSVSDGSAYTAATGTLVQSNGMTSVIYHRLAGAGGNITVTVTTSASHSTNCSVHEYTPASAFDVGGGAFSNLGSTSTDGDLAPSVTTTAANDLVFSLITETTTPTTLTAGTGYTRRQNGFVGGGTGPHAATEDGPKATAGAFQASWTAAAASNYIASVATFKK